MAKPTFNAILSYCSPEKPCLIFTPSRKQSQLTAIDLMTFAQTSNKIDRFIHQKHLAYLETTRALIHDATLAQTLVCGIAFFHSGLGATDREVVLQLYTGMHIQ